jgi:hypothetical protein
VWILLFAASKTVFLSKEKLLAVASNKFIVIVLNESVSSLIYFEKNWCYPFANLTVSVNLLNISQMIASPAVPYSSIGPNSL